MSLGNAIVFSRGIRYSSSTENCPNCSNAKLVIDNMYVEGVKYICPKCNHVEIRKENKT